MCNILQLVLAVDQVVSKLCALPSKCVGHRTPIIRILKTTSSAPHLDLGPFNTNGGVFVATMERSAVLDPHGHTTALRK